MVTFGREEAIANSWPDEQKLNTKPYQVDMEERYELKSVIIASQLPIAKWYDYIGDATLADAIID